jgi:hypothetical protein
LGVGGRGEPPLETPVVRHTSTSALTSFPIPFSSLVFGSTYFWKCLYTDTDGHPSFESPEQSFIFGTPSTITPDVRLNEIFARGTGPDFIEIHNCLESMGNSNDGAFGTSRTQNEHEIIGSQTSYVKTDCFRMVF